MIAVCDGTSDATTAQAYAATAAIPIGGPIFDPIGALASFAGTIASDAVSDEDVSYLSNMNPAAYSIRVIWCNRAALRMQPGT